MVYQSHGTMTVIKFLTNYAECGQAYKKDQIVQFKPGCAKRLVEAGMAEYYSLPTEPAPQLRNNLTTSPETE